MSTFTMTSPTSKGAIPSGITEIGGVVLDLVGVNGVRIVSQISASNLFQGYSANQVLDIGTQAGFTQSVINSLGGGLAEAAIRVTLYDGDTAAGNFDFHQNTLQLNGQSFGDFSDIKTQVTSSNGLVVSQTTSGFPDNQLATGWFASNNATLLANLYQSIVSKNAVTFQVKDVDPNDNYYDFKQGVAGGLINVGQPPKPVAVAPTVAHHDLTPVLDACSPFATLGADDLQATDPDSALLTYTVDSLSSGILLVHGEIAAAGVTFTQADIDSGSVSLLGGAVLPSVTVATPNGAISGAGIGFIDSFHFSVSDGTTPVAGTFNAAYAAFDTVQTSPQYGGYWGGNGNDYQLGTAADDNMSGGNGCDTMIGGNGNDQLHGGEGNNRIFGGAGNDIMTGGNGNDLLDGGANDDQLHANGGNNIVIGGDGADTLTAGEGNDRMFGGNGDDRIDANGGNNAINGGAGNDRINSGNGNDVIIGGAGDDIVYANGGSNTFKLGGIAGSASDGNDQYSTGNGVDLYALFLNDAKGAAAGWGNDTINGFRIAEGDQLVAFNPTAGYWDDANALTSLVQSGFVSGTRSADGGDLKLTFAQGQATQSTVTLKWFFWDNGSFLSNSERATGFGQQVATADLVGILQDTIKDGGSVGVSGADYLVKAHHLVSDGFMLA